MNEAFESALVKLRASKNYAGVCPDTLERVLRECFARHKKPKDAEKAAREKLHGITGAFMSPAECARAAAALERWTPGDDETLTEALSQHASTRERLPLKVMDALYDRVFAAIDGKGRVLDLACGLNPLYLAARGHEVTGVDIQGQAVALIEQMREKHVLPVQARCADLLVPGSLPAGPFHLTLAFKLLPVLEAQKRGAGADLLNTLTSDWIAISFPTRTLGGRNVGMAAHYGEWMEAHVPEHCRIQDSFTLGQELVYVLRNTDRREN